MDVQPMSRPPRIEFADAWYHVMNRARFGQDAFYHKFEKIYGKI